MKMTLDDSLQKENEDYLNHFKNDLIQPVFSHGFDLLKLELWEMLKAVSHESYIANLDICRLMDIDDTLCALIENNHFFVNDRKSYNFKHLNFNNKYVPNPFRQLKKHRAFNEGEKYSYQSPFFGILNKLSKREIRNFTLPIKGFLSVGIEALWHKLNTWHGNASRKGSPILEGFERDPLQTYDSWIKLIEAAYVADDFITSQKNRAVNYNLFIHEEVIIEFDPYQKNNFNPFKELNWIFNMYNVSMLKNEFEEWFHCAVNQEKIWSKTEPGHLLVLHKHLVTLIEAGFLITKFDEIPTEWLDPNKYEGFAIPKPETIESYIQYLTKEECFDLSNTISFLYKEININNKRNDFKKLLHKALSAKEKPFEDLYHFFERTNRIIEALYLINLNVSNKHNSI